MISISKPFCLSLENYPGIYVSFEQEVYDRILPKIYKNFYKILSTGKLTPCGIEKYYPRVESKNIPSKTTAAVIIMRTWFDVVPRE